MNGKLIKIIYLLIIFGVWPSLALAAPSVNSVSGLDILTITGSNFGTKTTVAPVRFDSFDAGNNGDPILPNQAGGGWATEAPYPSYSTVKTRYPGAKSALQDYYYGHPAQGLLLNNIKAPGTIPTTNKVYVSEWFTVEHSSATLSRNVKLINMGPVDPAERDAGETGCESRIDTYPFNGTGHLYVSTSDTCIRNGTYAQAWGVGYSTVQPEDGKWHRLESYFKIGTGGSRDVWIDGRKIAEVTGQLWGDNCSPVWIYLGHYVATDWAETSRNPISGTLCSPYIPKAVLKSSVDSKYYTCQSNGYFDAGTTVMPEGASIKRYVDEAYIDITPARVEICNASTKANSTHCEIQKPSAWSPTSVSFIPNYGTFTTGQSAYLYVVNSDNEVNANGHAITIGSSSADTNPPLVSSTSPTNHATGITKNAINSIIFNENLNCATVNTSSVTMSPSNIQSVSCQNSVITITPTNQTDSTLYAIAASTAITDSAGNHLASPYTFSYTTATPSATCTTDATLCTTESDCTTSHPTFNFCPGETPACKSTACTNTCSQTNWYLCTNQTDCENSNLYWWENACRTIPEPLLWYGENLVTNPKFDTWTSGLPNDWHSYLTANIEQSPLGARMFDQGHLYQTVIEPNTQYIFAYNLPIVNGQSEIWYYNTSIFNSEDGTITGSFTTPAEPISDHGLYFKTPAGSDNVINDVVLKKAVEANCATDPILCATQLACTNAAWNYCDGTCQAAPCILPVATRSDVDNSEETNTTDAMLTLRNSLGLTMTETAWQEEIGTGDANCDDVSNSTDALLILRYSVGLEMEGTEWCG